MSSDRAVDKQGVALSTGSSVCIITLVLWVWNLSSDKYVFVYGLMQKQSCCDNIFIAMLRFAHELNQCLVNSSRNVN